MTKKMLELSTENIVITGDEAMGVFVDGRIQISAIMEVNDAEKAVLKKITNISISKRLLIF